MIDIESIIEDNVYEDDILKDGENFKLPIEENKNQINIDDTKSKDYKQSNLDDFSDNWLEIVDLTEDQKTMNVKAREHMESIAKNRWFDSSIDFRTHYATTWMDKLFIKEEWTKWEHDALDKYLRQFADVLWIKENREKIKIITDIRRSGNDLFSR